MMTVRRSSERGFADHGWLKSYHSFSFADYHDPAHMGFGPLRVINEDRVAAGQGFGSHAHRDMEIISVVLDGELAHRDSLGNASVIRPGDVQRMSAGTGVRHSEFNHSPDRTTHFLQIWIHPDRVGIAPGYEQRHFDASARRGRLRLIVSPEGHGGSVRLHQDARIYAGTFDADESAEWLVGAGRLGYVHVARGSIELDGELLAAGDAAQVHGAATLRLGRGAAADVLVFDLPAHA